MIGTATVKYFLEIDYAQWLMMIIRITDDLIIMIIDNWLLFLLMLMMDG
jgi:hypothetical protein